MQIRTALTTLTILLVGCAADTTELRPKVEYVSSAPQPPALAPGFVEAYEKAGRPLIAVFVQEANDDLEQVRGIGGRETFERVVRALTSRIRQDGKVFIVHRSQKSAARYQVAAWYFSPEIVDAHSEIRVNAAGHRNNDLLGDAEIDLNIAADQNSINRSADRLAEKIMPALIQAWNEDASTQRSSPK